VGTFCLVPVLSREEFDAIEFDAAFSGDHEAAAQRMSRLAVTGIQSESMPRAEAFLRAGEQWLLADDPAAAASGFRLALADGGPVFVDPRVPLSRALFQLGRSAEAQALISELEAEGRRDPRLCDLVAEVLVERSDLPAALHWATAGVEQCLRREADGGDHGGAAPGPAEAGPAEAGPAGSGPAEAGPAGSGPAEAGDDQSELRMLLSLRYRIRNDLGLPEDDYDRLLDEAPPGADVVAADGRAFADVPAAADGPAAATTSESDASSRSTMTRSPSAMAPDSRPRAS
jgi:hypothetical protein